MIKLFWTLYYKFHMKQEFAGNVANARNLALSIHESGKGKVNHFYNSNGDQIRGFHRPLPRYERQHPLITKYEH